MKKRIVMMMALLMSLGSAIASEISIADVVIPKGGQTELTISYQFDAANLFSGYNFTLTMPTGLTATNGSASEMKASGDCYASSHVLSSNYVEESRENIYTCFSTESEYFSGTTGTLLKIKLNADESLEIGTNLTVTVSDISLGKADATSEKQSNFTFNVSIVDPVDVMTILDETSTSVPTASDEAKDVNVKRTIKAGQWSTICLPFAMTEAQLKAAFGNDVQLAEFTEYEAEYDADDEVIGLDIKFSTVDLSEGLYADYPYLIKVSSNIDEFDVASVVVDPNEGDCIAEYDNGKTGKNRKVLGSFIGTYHADTTVPANCLFLSDNKFWYSTGNTMMKAFRGYFNLTEVLANVGAAGARIKLSVSNGKKEETTGIEIAKTANDDQNYYNLNGNRVEKVGKGIYIKNGKKIINK